MIESSRGGGMKGADRREGGGECEGKRIVGKGREEGREVRAECEKKRIRGKGEREEGRSVKKRRQREG